MSAIGPRTMARGKQFTDRLFGLRKRAQSGKHELDKLCAELDIEHRLTPPRSRRTNGMVERFNGRIEDLLQSHHFGSGEELGTTLHRYVWLYHQQCPQSALGSKTPVQAMKDWHKLKPDLVNKQPYYRPGCDTCQCTRTVAFADRNDPAPGIWPCTSSHMVQPAAGFFGNALSANRD